MERPATGVWRSRERRRAPGCGVGIAALLVVLAASCAGPAQTTATATLLSYDSLGALYANGTLPVPSPASACGSATATYLAELQNTNPINAKVPMHWGDIIAGKDMMVAGTVQSPDVGNLDLPFDHPFGGDMSFDLTMDSPYVGLGGSYGANGINADQPADVVHVELESGLLPHNPNGTPGPPTGQAWQDAANADTANLMPGYTPQNGDRALVMGRWIIDCGHSDFHTEIHPINFVALSRTSGSTTDVFTFYNPYHDSQLYNPDASIASNVTDPSRISQANTQPFPAFLVSEILRLAHVGDPGSPSGYPSTFTSPSLEEANTDSPVLWYACAPPGTTGSHLKVSYDLSVRPGVWLSVTPNSTTGCAAVATVISTSYVPLAPVQRQCVLPWDWLNQVAGSEAGNPNLNIQQTIQNDLPPSLQSNTYLQQAVQQNPVTDCYDPLSVATPDPVGTPEHVVTTSSVQPYPLYGWITVAWGS